MQVLGAWSGVCRDTIVGGTEDYQPLSAQRHAGVTTVTFRRMLHSSDALDRDWSTSQETHVVWAVGRLDEDGEPAFHTEYPRADLEMRFGDEDFVDTCEPFIR